MIVCDVDNPSLHKVSHVWKVKMINENIWWKLFI